MPHQFFSQFIRWPFFLRILIIAMTVIFCFGFVIYIVEPETFHNVFEGIWWAVITASTVGYGDLVPKTFLGKLLGILLILLGAGFLSSYFITLASSAVTMQTDFLEGKAKFFGKDHILVIGWNERSKEIINKLLKNKDTRAIVLIDQTLDSNPFSDYHVHFIKGRANLDETLIKANIYDVKTVMITADQNKDELQADMNTILTLLTIKGLNPHTTCVVEILTSEQTANARRAGADEIIQTNVISSSVMLNCLYSGGMVDPLLSFLEQFNGNRFVYQASNDFVGKSFIETGKVVLENGNVLFGINRGAETFINPPHPFTIKDKDILLVITP